MNYHTEVSIRVRDAEGNIKEQFVDTLYQLHPENFQLEARNLTAVLAITGRYNGVSYTTAKGQEPHVEVYSHYPRLYQPQSAHMTVMVNGESVLDEEMTVGKTPDDNGAFPATLQNGYLDLILKEGDQVIVKLAVTDSLGRERTFTDGGILKEGRLEHVPMAVPEIWE